MQALMAKLPRLYDIGQYSLKLSIMEGNFGNPHWVLHSHQMATIKDHLLQKQKWAVEKDLEKISIKE